MTPASAAVISTWTGVGGSGNWSTVSNWSTSPTGTSSLVFGGTTQTTGTNTIGTVTVDSLSFTNNGAAGQTALFTLSGSTLALSSATITTTATTVAFSGGQAAAGDIVNMPLSLTGSNTVTTGAGHALSLGGSISGGGSITYGGAASAIVYLSGSNSNTGGTFVNGGVVYTAAQGSATGANNAFGGNVTISGSGSVFVRQNTLLANNFTISGTGSDGLGLIRGSFGGAVTNTATLSGTITLAGDSQIRSVTSGTTAGNVLSITGPVNLGSNVLTLNPAVSGANPPTRIEISGKISGSGSVVLSGSGTGGSSAYLGGANDYTGGTTVSSGTLKVGSATALGTGFLKVDTNGVDLNGQTLSVGALFGSSSGVITTATTGASRLTTNFNAVSGTYAGAIQNGVGTVGYTKQGTGTQFLSGTSNYTGTTVVGGGSLYVNGQLGNTATAVLSGGALSGNGTILGGVTVNSGGTLSAGPNALSIGALTVGGLTLDAGATTALTVSGTAAGTFDKIISTGSTAFGGVLTIDMNYAGGTFDANLAGSIWDLFTASSFGGNLSSITMTGTYGNVAFFQIPGGGGRWESQYLGGGKEFAFFTGGPLAGKLYAVPEPSTIALCAIGGLSAIGLRWRRRRHPGVSASS